MRERQEGRQRLSAKDRTSATGNEGVWSINRGRRWVAFAPSPCILAAHLCLLGFGARPLSQPPAFCDPTRKQGNRELVLESGRRVPYCESCILNVCDGDSSMKEVLVQFDVKGMNVLRDPIFGSSFGVETARANHHCVSVYMLLRVIPLLVIG